MYVCAARRPWTLTGLEMSASGIGPAVLARPGTTPPAISAATNATHAAPSPTLHPRNRRPQICQKPVLTMAAHRRGRH